MLEINKISKVYITDSYRQMALDNISINFRANEFVSILGPSGSGKTTLLNIIGGLDNYTEGDLIINGKSTKEYTDRDWDTYRNHRVGFIFQTYNLIPHQSVLANVELALTLSGVSKKERKNKAIKVLTKVGLKNHIYKRPNQLSGGQMQRVAIARALINDPDILLADEPTGALDTETSKQIMTLLKEIADDKLVVMVTHNPELANIYSTRIVKVLDGHIIDDSDPYDGVSEEVKQGKDKKTNMSFITALSLSLNNLMTKKGRTLLTAFAGSIGIIGIALIMSLSNGIQKYIDKTEKETLSSYPLTIQKESINMGSMLISMTNSRNTKKFDDNKIHAINIMGDMFTTISQEVNRNDLKTFKKYIENNNEIKKYVTDIQYGYNVTLNVYKNTQDEILRVNPTTVLETVGMGTNGISSAYSSYMSNYNVFYEMLDNDNLLHTQYDLVSGSWPTKYDEVVLQIGKNNEIIDYSLYSLGILDQKDLKEQFNNMTSGKEVSFASYTYEPSDLLGLTFKLVANTDFYTKSGSIWIDKSNDETYMKSIINNGLELKIVGIIKPNDEAVTGSNAAGMIGYRHDLVSYLVNKINEAEITKEQLNNHDINVFTGKSFNNNTFDMSSLSQEEMMSLSKMSQDELATYMNTIKNNISSTYEQNLTKIGVSDLEDPSSISIYPKDFDSKEEIVKIIEEYNKDKKEEDKIEYTDMVGIMMSSVSTIVNVISSVLIAFVSISLIVSSIMIAIITYISVLERTKEIGILRSIGASKKDISRVFNAETLIEGLVAGILGVVVTLLLNIPINSIIKSIVNISGIASLPLTGAIGLILISIILTVIAGFIPAKIASKKDPVIALRTE